MDGRTEGALAAGSFSPDRFGGEDAGVVDSHSVVV